MINARLLMTMLIAGALATVAFDLFGQSLAPMLGFTRLSPVPLANQVIGALFGSQYAPGAYLLHYFAGLVAYPLGWLLIADPLARRAAPFLPWFFTAVIYGVMLWVVALYGMGHLIAGNPAFLGFNQLAWVALVGHIVFAVVAAAVARWRET